MPVCNPYAACLLKELAVDGKTYRYFSLPALNDPRVAELPYCIRILLEDALRNCDDALVPRSSAEALLDYHKSAAAEADIAFMPSRVILQDFTGVPALVDLAAMRDMVDKFGGDPSRINPLIPVDLVVDHSVQIDSFGGSDAFSINTRREMDRNRERFAFLKWGAKAFANLTIVPPGAGIVHQVNLEYLARVLFVHEDQRLLYPDTVIGTDSHTPMVNGLGVLGWGVGGIEAETAMLGQPVSMVIPRTVGLHFTGDLRSEVTATDLVLTITHLLREASVVGAFVEAFGPSLSQLTIADRATLSNMSPEMGCTVLYFPVDAATIQYMSLTGRCPSLIRATEAYFRAQHMFVEANAPAKIKYTTVVEVDLSKVEPSIAGPKRPHDHALLRDAAANFRASLTAPVGFRGFGITDEEKLRMEVTVRIPEGDPNARTVALRHGSIVIAAITSCTNTSNPAVMIAAGLLAKNAVSRGLGVMPSVKTSLAPGSQVVMSYLRAAGLIEPLEALGFYLVGFGCTTCIGNSGPLAAEVARVLDENDMVAVAVLSGNRNFEGRIHPQVRANYLASPPLVVAYAIAGRIDMEWESEPLGVDAHKNPVYLRDIWPSRSAIAEVVARSVNAAQFKEVYSHVTSGLEDWQALKADPSVLYPWDDASTYIHSPPFFDGMSPEVKPEMRVAGARCLLLLGDSITTDHISPAGTIPVRSAAAAYLMERGVKPRDFNTFGARRGNDQVMVRGTFCNMRLLNQLAMKPGPWTLHHPSGEVVEIYEAAQRYRRDNTPLVVLAGQQYGSGSSRDWAAKGVSMLNVRAIVAESYERIHRCNLALTGVIPLQFKPGQSASSLGLTGGESFDIDLGCPTQLHPGMTVVVKVSGGSIPSFDATLRLDTEMELVYFQHRGVLHYVIRKTLQSVS